MSHSLLCWLWSTNNQLLQNLLNNKQYNVFENTKLLQSQYSKSIDKQDTDNNNDNDNNKLQTTIVYGRTYDTPFRLIPHIDLFIINSTIDYNYSTALLFHLCYQYSIYLLSSNISTINQQQCNILYITHIQYELTSFPILPNHITTLNTNALNNITIKTCADIYELQCVICGITVLDKLPLLIVIDHMDSFISTIDNTDDMYQLWVTLSYLYNQLQYIQQQVIINNNNNNANTIPVQAYVNINADNNTRYQHVTMKYASEHIIIHTSDDSHSNDLTVSYKPILSQHNSNKNDSYIGVFTAIIDNNNNINITNVQ